MRSDFRRNSLYLALGALIGAATTAAAKPLWQEAVIALNQNRYGELVYLCDSAMREHYLARARVVEEPIAETAIDLAMAEIALIDCQDYDLYQKRLMQWGLTENELSRMRLRAIEGGGGSLFDVVRFHEIRD